MIREIEASLKETELLIIVSPLADLRSPVLGAHIIQACAKIKGYSASVLYSNFLLAKEIGLRNFMAFGPLSLVYAGDFFFSPHAYDAEPVHFSNKALTDRYIQYHEEIVGHPIQKPLKEALDKELQTLINMPKSNYDDVQEQVTLWLNKLAKKIANYSHRFVGCSTMFYDQLSANLSLLKHIKQYENKKITILGGSQCKGIMAKSIAECIPYIDYVFEGEAELSFSSFLDSDPDLPPLRFIHEQRPIDLNKIPQPDFSDFELQFPFFAKSLDTDRQIKTYYRGIPMETSRGCSWMDTAGCTFCSLAPDGLSFRTKTPERVAEEIKSIIEKHGVREVDFVDLIIDKENVDRLAPIIEAEFDDLILTGEVRADLGFNRIKKLKRAGFKSVQIGIETFSNNLLRKMGKGVGLRNVIDSLRFCRSLGISVAYNFLWGFPDEPVKEYQKLLSFLPKLIHLNAPVSIIHVQFERFCEYVTNPSKFGIKNLRPSKILTPMAPKEFADQINYIFVGEYECETHSNQDVIAEIYSFIESWRNAWYEPRYNGLVDREIRNPPVLRLRTMKNGRFRVLDTRNLTENGSGQIINKSQAIATLRSGRVGEFSAQDWAVDCGYAIQVDGWHLALATADENTLEWALACKVDP